MHLLRRRLERPRREGCMFEDDRVGARVGSSATRFEPTFYIRQSASLQQPANFLGRGAQDDTKKQA